MAPHRRSEEHPDFDEALRKESKGHFRFERTFNVGHVLTAILMLVGGIGVWTNLLIVASKQDTRMNFMERDQAKMKDVLEKQAEIQYKMAGALEILARKQP